MHNQWKVHEQKPERLAQSQCRMSKDYNRLDPRLQGSGIYQKRTKIFDY